MYDHINWTFHIFFMLFFLGLGSVLFWRARRERNGWARAAASENLIFEERNSQRLKPWVEKFHLLGGSVLDDPTEVLFGTRKGQELLVFNWFFQSESSVQALRGGFACLLVPLSRPLVSILLVHQDHLAFASHPGEKMVLDNDPLMANYHLYCKNRQQADPFFTKELVAELLKEPHWLEVANGHLLVAKPGAWEPKDVPDALAKWDRWRALTQPASSR